MLSLNAIGIQQFGNEDGHICMSFLLSGFLLLCVRVFLFLFLFFVVFFLSSFFCVCVYVYLCVLEVAVI